MITGINHITISTKDLAKSFNFYTAVLGFRPLLKYSSAKIWKQNKSEGDSLYFLDPDHHKLELHVGNWSTRIEEYKLNKKLTNPIYYV